MGLRRLLFLQQMRIDHLRELVTTGCRVERERLQGRLVRIQFLLDTMTAVALESVVRRSECALLKVE